MKKIQYSLDQIDDAAKVFIEDIKNKQIVALIGGLGAGKTTLVQNILRKMGVSGPVSSPTFTYFNQYQLSDGTLIYHFDLYRLKSLAEFEAAGFFEYLYLPNSIAFIEWPEIIDSALNESVCRAKISVVSDTERILEYE